MGTKTRVVRPANVSTSAQRRAQILEYLAECPDGATANSIAVEVKMGYSTVTERLRDLQSMGMVTRGPAAGNKSPLWSAVAGTKGSGVAVNVVEGIECAADGSVHELVTAPVDLMTALVNSLIKDEDSTTVDESAAYAHSSQTGSPRAPKADASPKAAFGRGQLQEATLAYLQTLHAGDTATPYEIAKYLNAHVGAVAWTLDRLVVKGNAVKAGTQPYRYRAA